MLTIEIENDDDNDDDYDNIDDDYNDNNNNGNNLRCIYSIFNHKLPILVIDQ